MGKLQSKHGKSRRITTRDSNNNNKPVAKTLYNSLTLSPRRFSPSSLPRLKRVNAEKTPKVSGSRCFVCVCVVEF